MATHSSKAPLGGGRLGSGKAGFNSFKFFAGFLQGVSMALDIDGRLKRSLEAFKEQVDTIFGLKASMLSQEMIYLLVDGHPEFSLG